MRRFLLSAIVAVILGACLVLAQPGTPPRSMPTGATLPGLPAPVDLNRGTATTPTTIPITAPLNVPVPMDPSGFQQPGPYSPPLTVIPQNAFPTQTIPPNYVPAPANVPTVPEVLGIQSGTSVPGLPAPPPVPEVPGLPLPGTNQSRTLRGPVSSPGMTIEQPAPARPLSPAYSNIQMGNLPQGTTVLPPGQSVYYQPGEPGVVGGPQPGYTQAPPGNAIYQPGVGMVYQPTPQSNPGVVTTSPQVWTQPTQSTNTQLTRTTTLPQENPSIWFNAEGLLWWMRSSPVPILVATVPNRVPGQALSGSQIRPLFGDKNINSGVTPGLRGTFGMWLDPGQTIGVTGGYYWLQQQSRDFSYQSQGDPTIARTFLNLADNNRPGLIQLAGPGGSVGGSQIRYETQLQGGDVSAMFSRNEFLGQKFDWLVGFRYFDFEEQLKLSDTMTNIPRNIAFTSFDQFATRNRFYGGQVGTHWNFTGDRVTTEMTLKLGYGPMQQRVSIDGVTNASIGTAGVTTYPGGTLALPTNTGDHTRTKMAFIPELTMNVGYRIATGATLFAGYNLLYVSDVVRPGSQIDPAVNPDFLPLTRNTGATTLVRPGLVEHSNDFFTMGLTFGLMINY